MEGKAKNPADLKHTQAFALFPAKMRRAMLEIQRKGFIMDDINLKLTKEQYLTLLELVYAGNLMLTSADEAGEERYNEAESAVFAQAKSAGMEEYAEYDDIYQGYLPTEKFEDAADMDQKLEAFQNNSFWDDLIHRLSLIDVLNNVQSDNDDILMEALLERTSQYEEFFQEHGLESVQIKGMPPMEQPSLFRSTIVGAPEGESDEHDDSCCDHHHSH